MDFYFMKIEPYNKNEIKLLYEQAMIDCFGKIVNKIDSLQKITQLGEKIKKFNSI